MSGKVYLVGAGPGDPDLLTLKAVKALGRADVILVDDLVAPEILAHASATARIVPVGKRGGCRSTPQEFIERLMIAEARRGLTVVRLKGGDPFIFGRGGEECDALRAAGIEHEVVNGITAGLAAASAIGIPLTHRALCHGAIFVTGHAGAAGGADWPALAATGLPLVIYMGAGRVAEIERELLAAGMPPETPSAAISNATRENQRSIATRLGSLALDVAASGLASPCILVVGEIARRAVLAQPLRHRSAPTWQR
ncbi:MAG TPA: uroporphyrinogen-III C-methyltransferase [Usitatibacter sp.]|nr:uroporphyrinogen-III C-methyltransferase [Usitatibacter sp.]